MTKGGACPSSQLQYLQETELAMSIKLPGVHLRSALYLLVPLHSAICKQPHRELKDDAALNCLLLLE